MFATSDPDPFLHITIGSPIYTRDYEKLGTVKELRGNTFKVGTPLLQRDFWLDAAVVRSAASDGAVMLVIDKADLGDHKRKEPPAAA
jgi:hypothetical protein